MRGRPIEVVQLPLNSSKLLSEEILLLLLRERLVDRLCDLARDLRY